MEQETHEQPEQEPRGDMFVVTPEDDGNGSAVIVNHQMHPDGASITTDVIGQEGVAVNVFIGETDPEKLALIRQQLAQRALGIQDYDD